MRKFFINICFLLSLSAALTVSAAFAQSAWKVRNGEGVGPYSIGMTFSECEKTLHRDKNADQVFVRRKQPFWIYYTDGIQINYDHFGKVIQIFVDKPGILTDKGIQVGDPQDKFLAAYGRGCVSHELPTAKSQPKQSVYIYKNMGLGFQVEGGIVKFIIVTLKHS
ncbi:hypothetical protein IJT93_07925 [bacterium]|nr:hypothetical protein [bacterium]